ncbi:hypothetical protein V8G54_008416 [Vigna mungo]|uniref:Uncharacterized protein n=1 Tax=Vigna mungo TaxID=3915 RepID=A0AAQ3S9Z6_VIGMU
MSELGRVFDDSWSQELVRRICASYDQCRLRCIRLEIGFFDNSLVGFCGMCEEKNGVGFLNYSGDLVGKCQTVFLLGLLEDLVWFLGSWSNLGLHLNQDTLNCSPRKNKGKNKNGNKKAN